MERGAAGADRARGAARLRARPAVPVGRGRPAASSAVGARPATRRAGRDIRAIPRGRSSGCASGCSSSLPRARGESPARVASRAVRPSRRRARGARAPSSGPGELHGVPPLPAGFVAREELAGCATRCWRAGDGAVGITGKALGLHGQGGIGKTVLAAALARDDGVRRHFPDGVFWVTVGEQGGSGRRAARPAGAAGRRARRAALGEPRARAAARRRWPIAAACWSSTTSGRRPRRQAFRATGPRGRVLYTTRDAGVLRRGRRATSSASTCCPHAAARELLAGLAGTRRSTRCPPRPTGVLEATGRVALALALVGAAVGRGGRTWSEVAERARARQRRRSSTIPTPTRSRRCRSRRRARRASSPRRTAALAVYPEDTPIPVAAVARYWRYLSTSSTRARRERGWRRSPHASCSRSTTTRISFHDLQRDFLLLQVERPQRCCTPTCSAPTARCCPTTSAVVGAARTTSRTSGSTCSTTCAAPATPPRSSRRQRSGLPRGPRVPQRAVRGRGRPAPSRRAASRRSRDRAGCCGCFTHWGHLLAGHARARRPRRHAGQPHPRRRPRVDAAALGGCSRRRPVAALGAARRRTRAHARPRGPHRRGERGRVLARRPPARQRRRRRDGAAVGRRQRPAHRDARRPHRRGERGRVLARRRAGSPAPATTGRCGCGTPRSGQPTATLEGHTGGVRAVAFSPDGAPLASAGERRDGAAVGRRQRRGRPRRSKATPAGCTRWRSRPTAAGSPAPATTGRCGCGTRPAAAQPRPSRATPAG